MKALSPTPNLVEQVRDALLTEIASGKLKPGERIIQEQIAQALGVSRQPVQQALMLLRNQGVLRDAGGRGLIVTPLDPDRVQHVYQIRAAIEGLVCRLAAENHAEMARKQGAALIDAALLHPWPIETWSRYWKRVSERCTFKGQVSFEWMVSWDNFVRVKDGEFGDLS